MQLKWQVLNAAKALLTEDAAIKADYESEILTMRTLRAAVALKLNCAVEDVGKAGVKEAIMAVVEADGGVEEE